MTPLPSEPGAGAVIDPWQAARRLTDDKRHTTAGASLPKRLGKYAAVQLNIFHYCRKKNVPTINVSEQNIPSFILLVSEVF